jgi:3D (Asp-Asp-Asp) domain-containing protein
MVLFKVTGYCPCMKCCGKTDGITASGVKATANHTIAAPRTYPFGTRINLNGYGVFVVEDRGGAIQGNRLDRFFNTHQEALNWGVRNVEGSVV